MAEYVAVVNAKSLARTNAGLEQLLHNLRTEVTLMRESIKINENRAQEAQPIADESKT